VPLKEIAKIVDESITFKEPKHHQEQQPPSQQQHQESQSSKVSSKRSKKQRPGSAYAVAPFVMQEDDLALAVIKNGARPGSACSALLVTVVPQGDKKKKIKPQQRTRESTVDLTSNCSAKDSRDQQQQQQQQQQVKQEEGLQLSSLPPSIPHLKLQSPSQPSKSAIKQKQEQQQHHKPFLPPIPPPPFFFDGVQPGQLESGSNHSKQRLTLEELMHRHQQTKKVAVEPGLEKRVCCLCKAVYRETDNHDSACSWHPGKRCDLRFPPQSKCHNSVPGTGVTGHGRAATAERAIPARVAG
jgi:hypothetical protein